MKHGLYGTAKWASDLQLRVTGLRSTRGLWLGETANKKPIRFDGEGHVLTVAPPGAGKTVGLVIPTLVEYDSGSVIVTDPKGTLTAQTKKARESLGNRVVVLNPWRDEMAKEFRVDLGDTGFNPLGILKADDQALHDNAEMVAAILCPTPHDAKEPYWTEAARSILTGCLIHLAKDDVLDCTLPDLYELVRGTPDQWRALAHDFAAAHDARTPYAGEILSCLDSDRQWSGVLGAMHTTTAIYAPTKALGFHVAQDKFDPADLKREDITVYLVVPSNRREANKAWLALVTAMFAEAVGRPGPARPVLLLAEEFANLGYMPSIGRAMAEYREAGLRCWLIIQTLNQLHQHYGREGAQQIFDLCLIRQFFGVHSLPLAQELERTIGTLTVQRSGRSEKIVWPGGKEWKPEGSESLSPTALPLIRAQDIMNLPHHAQILLMGGALPAVFARIVPYFRRSQFKGRVAPNPYRKEEKRTASLPVLFAGVGGIGLLMIYAHLREWLMRPRPAGWVLALGILGLFALTMWGNIAL